MKKALIIILCVILSLSCPACAGKGSNESGDTDETASFETQDDKPGPDTQDASAKKPDTDQLPSSGEDQKNDEGTDSLAKRLCGRYSCKENDDEYFIIEIYEFAGNVYAYAGDAMDDEAMLEAYNFWGMEILPVNAQDMLSSDSDSCDVGVLRFSIMSNLSKYQNAPELTTISLTDDGIRLWDRDFVRDERVEGTFPYMNDHAGSDVSCPEGLWRETDSDDPCYIEFRDSNIRLYRKSADREVLFGCGGLAPDADEPSFRYSMLGMGTMPYDLKIDHHTDGNDLIISPVDDYELFFDEDREYTFEPIDESDVPVITLSDAYAAGYDDRYEYDMYLSEGTIDDQPFYGVWISAFEYSADAQGLVYELNRRGLDASYVLSCDWSNLSTKAYYCVTAGRCETEEEADKLLEDVRSAGYKDAYVKYSGSRIGTRVEYTLYSLDDVEVTTDQVILHNVQVDDLSSYNSMHMDLVIDRDSAFDTSCELEFFGNYEQGDTAYDWFVRNYTNAMDSSDGYDAAIVLRGVFDVSLTDQHIDRYYGSYWWD